jgi:hypothetical protein
MFTYFIYEYGQSQSQYTKTKKGESQMGKQKKEIKAILHLPESKSALHNFEKRLSDFYAVQVEQRLRSLPKDEKLQVLETLLVIHK